MEGGRAFWKTEGMTEVLAQGDLNSLKGQGWIWRGPPNATCLALPPVGVQKGWEDRGPCRAQNPAWADPEGIAPHLCLAGNVSAQEQVTKQGTNRAKQISTPATCMGAAQQFVT